MKHFEETKREYLSPLMIEAGAALYDSQAFEQGLIYLLYLLSKLEGTEDLEQRSIEDILENKKKKTAGQIIGILKKHVSLTAEVEGILSDALDERNFIIHRFFTDNIERILDPKEIDNLVNDIKKRRHAMGKCRAYFDTAIKTLAEAIDGVSIDHIEKKAVETFMAEMSEPIQRR
jgi:hypothetical protein